MRKKAVKVELKVESHRKEDSFKNLAIRLADRLQKEINAREDAHSFKKQAQHERQKAKKISNVIVMLIEYRRKKERALKAGEEWNPSRMEPMETYDEDVLKNEKLMLINRARDFDDMANEYEDIANKAKQRALEIQRKLAKNSGD